MAYTTPATSVAGTVLTASHLNTYVRDNVAWLATDAPACRAYNSAAVAVASSGTASAITLNSERYDNGAIHSTSSNTSRMTVPSGGGGKYLVGGGLQWSISAAGNYRQLRLIQNATTYIGYQTSQPSATHASEATCTTSYALAAADYVEMFGCQDSGGSLNVTVGTNYAPELWLTWYRV